MSMSKLEEKTGQKMINEIVESVGDESSRINLPKLNENKIELPPCVDEKPPAVVKKYQNKYMKKYPELFAWDVSTHPSYTGLKNLPYSVICRRRLQKTRKFITRQLNSEITHMAMMQSYALGSVRVERMLTVGFPPEATIIPDFATDKERRRINDLLNDR